MTIPKYDLHTYELHDLLTICILSGCDYLDSIPRVGLKRAMKTYKDCEKDIEAFIETYRAHKSYTVPENYLKDFKRAYVTFKCQVVYCPETKKRIHLNDPKDVLYASEFMIDGKLGNF